MAGAAQVFSGREEGLSKDAALLTNGSRKSWVGLGRAHVERCARTWSPGDVSNRLEVLARLAMRGKTVCLAL